MEVRAGYLAYTKVCLCVCWDDVSWAAEAETKLKLQLERPMAGQKEVEKDTAPLLSVTSILNI